MCESHTIYHLCGHVKVKTLVQCADMIDKLIASKMQVTCSHQLCADVSDNTHIFPDICVKCEENGVIGEFLNQEPGRKLEILRDWKKQNKSISESPTGEPPSTASDGQHEDTKQLETLEVLTVADISSSSTSSPQTESLPISSSPKSVSAASSTTSISSSPDLQSIKARVIALKDRTERLLTKARAHRSIRSAEQDE